MTAPTNTRSRRGAGGKRRAQVTTNTEQLPDAVQPVKSPRRTKPTTRTSVAERAYARRAQRAGLLRRESDAERGAVEPKSRRRLRWPASRASFVLMMMGLLAAGVATTLWLSTQAISDSYRLEQLRGRNARQAEQAAQLQRDVTKQESASSLAQKAQQLGMVPGGDPARIVVAPDGTTSLVGQPKKAHGAAPAPDPVTPVPAAAGTEPVQGAPIEGDQPAVPADTPAASQ
jgi:type II secretory pathway pseudopilin PulG